MAMNNMLTLAIYLDPTPGGVAPELHLKEGCSSVEAGLYIPVFDTSIIQDMASYLKQKC